MAAQAGSTWSVSGTRDDSVVDTTGGVVQGTRITFVTGTGQQSQVFVPEINLDPEVARAAIAAKAATLDQIAQLTG